MNKLSNLPYQGSSFQKNPNGYGKWWDPNKILVTQQHKVNRLAMLAHGVQWSVYGW
jgi:hypothetical protein